MNRDNAARSAERMAWQRYGDAVTRDLRTARPKQGRSCPPASAGTLAVGAAWIRAYRERELHEGRAR